MKNTEIVVHEAVQEQSLSLITPKHLKMQIKEETEKRKLILSFIKDHMKEGVDFGRIHIVKDCPNKYNCDNAYHFSKDTLFKPGAEKFCSLMKLRIEYHKDKDTWEMLGSSPGTVCYLAQLYTPNGQLVGEGRGVSSVAEKSSPNVAVKIAQKRAKLDATLSTGGLSDFFTQDLDDDDTAQEIEKKEKPKVSSEITFEKAKKMIEASTDYPALDTTVRANIIMSKLYSKQQKDALIKAIDIQVSKADAQA